MVRLIGQLICQGADTANQHTHDGTYGDETFYNMPFMSVKERNQDLRMVMELVYAHLPNTLTDSDLCKDICAVVAINLRRVADDIEKSAAAWDKKAYHSKADELRRQMTWVLPAAQVAESLAYMPSKFTKNDMVRLRTTVPEDLELEAATRARFKDVSILRGAAAAARQSMLKRK
jgi:hypothetical protein